MEWDLNSVLIGRAKPLNHDATNPKSSSAESKTRRFYSPLQLQQNEQLLDYLLSYRELMSWASEFQARMTSPELSENLQEATAVHSRHKQLHDEMKIRLETDFAVLVSVP